MVSVSWNPDRDLSLDLALARHTRWGADPVNVVQGGVYFRVAAGGIVYSARQRRNGAVEVSAESRRQADLGLQDLKYRLAESLSFEPVEDLASRDRYVAALIDEFAGYRPPMVIDPFEMLVGAISAQQVNLRWAGTTRARLVERFGRVHEWLGTKVWEFPAAARLAEAEPDELRRLQFSGAKSEAIVQLAQAGSAGELAGLHDLTNEQVIEKVTALRRIGRWSADWLLARCLARPDVVAAGDLGVRKAVSVLYLRQGELISEDEVREVTSDWGDAANWTAHLLLERFARSHG